MIYRHYKGGLYFLESYATKLVKEVMGKNNRVTVDLVAVAKFEATMEDVPVFIVHDKSVNGTYYAYDSPYVNGVMAFYRGLDGKYWLRPTENFHENVELVDGKYGDKYYVPRFERVCGEHLFDCIAERLLEKSNK